MSFWNRFFRFGRSKTTEPAARAPAAADPAAPMTAWSPGLVAWAEACAITSYESQLRLQDLITDKSSWWIDPESGRLVFQPPEGSSTAAAGTLSCPFQYLATVHVGHGLWAWAWDAPAGTYPPARLTAANEVRAAAVREGVSELTRPLLRFSDVPLVVAAAVSTHHAHADRERSAGLGTAYYRTPIGPTAAHIVSLTHPDLSLPRPNALRLQRALAMFAGDGWPIDHRRAIQQWARARSVELASRDRGLSLRFPAGDGIGAAELVVDLTDDARVAGFDLSVEPA